MNTLQLIEGLHYRVVTGSIRYKYELLIDLSLDISKYKHLKELSIDHEYYKIANGVITAKEGYRWDGPSGPTMDDETNLRASLFHDIGYQAMREQPAIKRMNLWNRYWMRRDWDRLFRVTLKADGMPFFRRQMYFMAVRGVGAFFAHF